MKRSYRSFKISACLLAFAMGCNIMMAQNEIPFGPGPVTSINGEPLLSPTSPPPPPAQGLPGQPAVPPASPLPPSQTPPPPPGWGAPGTLVNPPSADWMNQGTMNVMATGYDSEGVLKQIPLTISYNYNGVNYNITVVNAWNPYTQSWNMGIDQPAFSTDYYFNGFTYNWYAPLSLGTFYFNL